jgi:hypothetical protein
MSVFSSILTFINNHPVAKITAIIGGIVSFVAGPLPFIIDKFTPDPFASRVYVNVIKDSLQPIFESKGSVYMDINGRKTVRINNLGEAVFENIPDSFKFKNINIGLVDLNNYKITEVTKKDSSNREIYLKIVALQDDEIHDKPQPVVQNPQHKTKYRHISEALAISEAFTDPHTGASITLDKIDTYGAASGSIFLPGKEAQHAEGITASERWNFRYNNTSYTLMVKKINPAGNTYLVEVDEN